MGLGLLIIVGSIVAYGWSLCFKEYKPPAHPENQLMSSVQARRYGVLLGSVAATNHGDRLGAEHNGWIVGITLFAMRPNIEVQKWRSGGRVVSIFAGALTASWVLSEPAETDDCRFFAGALIARMCHTRQSLVYYTCFHNLFGFLCCYTDSQLLLILNIASTNECWRPCWVYVCLVSSSRRKN